MKTTKAVTAVLAGSLAFALIAGACGSSKSNTAATTAAGETSSSAAVETSAATTPATTAAPTPDLKATLNSSGSTFAKVYIEEAIADFTATNGGVTINYGGGGSGKGRQDLADQVTDFAGSDSPFKDADVGKFKGGDVLYFPIVLAPITVSYNLDGVDKLQLTPGHDREDLPAPDQEVERRGDRRRQPGCQAAGHRHRRRSPLRRLGHHGQLHQVPRRASGASGGGVEL